MNNATSTNISAVRLAVIALAYFITGRLGLELAIVGSHITLIWLPTGIAVAALFRWGWRYWPALFLGALAVNLSIGTSIWVSAGIAIGNTLGPILAVALLKRWHFNPDISRWHDVLIFVTGGAFIGMMVSATGGVLILAFNGLLPWENAGLAWLAWWLGDAVGVIIGGMPVITFKRTELTRSERKNELLASATTIAFVGLAWAAIPAHPLSHTFLMALTIVALVWIALRMGPWPAAMSVLMIAASAALALSAGQGPLLDQNLHLAIANLWADITTFSIVTMLVSALSAERKRTEEKLTENESHLRAIIETEPECIKILDAQGQLLQMNPAGLAMIEADSLEQVSGRSVLNLVAPEYRAAFAKAHKKVIAGESLELKFEVIGLKGGRRLLETHAVPMQYKGEIVLLGITRDITERKQSEEKLHLAASVFSHSREGIMIAGPDGTIIDVNDAYTRITGYSRDEAIGRNPRFLKSGRHDREFYTDLWRNLIEKGYWNGEIWNRRKNGEIYVEMKTISAVRDDRGEVQQYVALFSDITSYKEHEQQLEHIAHYDVLTNLPNRVLLADRLHQGMAQALRREQLLATAYLDLDGFKIVNDTHGHEIGDQLLVILAVRMKQALREGDTLSRMGGDEFVAVLGDLEDIAASTPMLTRLLTAAAEPVIIDDITLQVSASLGVTFYPQTNEVDADQLLRQADQAMYQAKLAGKNRYYIFDAEQDSSVRGHHESLERIRLALSEHELVLYYQPKVNMRTGEVVGAEALIRWQHPEKGLLPPSAFLSVIEDHALAVEIGEWVIDTALTQIEIWHAAGLNIPISVNVGARQLQQTDFVERLSKTLAAHPGIQPGFLELEVLETSALEDVMRISKVIAACKGMGVMFALDDFGTGYSSLTYLKRLPVTTLKIDQTFVRDMLEDPDDLAILEGVIGLATAFRREVIAEGVETVSHGEMLLQLGCAFAQGYGIARPMPAHEMPGWSASWRPDPAWIGLPSVSRDDFPLLFASVEHRAWISNLGKFLKHERNAPPSQDHHQCHFGIWMDTDGLTRYGSQPDFKAVERLHRQIHSLSSELCELHAMSRNQEALARLDELLGLRDALLEQLKILLQRSQQQ